MRINFKLTRMPTFRTIGIYVLVVLILASHKSAPHQIAV